MITPYAIIGALVAILLSGLAGGFIGWHERSLLVPHELEQQQGVDANACDKAQLITKGANDALQKDRDAIAHKLAALKLQHPSACVHPSRAAQLPDSGQQHAGQDGAGINTDWLRNYAAEAEQYRTGLVTCSAFITSERTLTQPK